MSTLTAAWREAKTTTRTLIAAYLVIGVGLTLQPERFANTPSYANLLVFARSQVWGVMYLLVAALLIGWRLSPKARWLGVLAHTAAITLTAWWWVAFVVRYATDDGTTVVNIVSWGVFLTLAARSAHWIDPEPETTATLPLVS